MGLHNEQQWVKSAERENLEGVQAVSGYMADKWHRRWVMSNIFRE